MSEKILKALMQLFAIIARPQSSDSDRRSVVEAFLKRQLNLELVREYLKLFDDFYNDAQDRGKRSRTERRNSATAVRILKICIQINDQLTQDQKIIVLVQLFEFCKSDSQEVSITELEFIAAVADTFNVESEEFDLIRDFVLNPSTKIPDSPNVLVISNTSKKGKGNYKFLINETIKGSIWVLNIHSAGMHFVRFSTIGELYMNGQLLAEGKVYPFNPGSSLRDPKSTPIYYSDAIRQFIKEELKESRVVYKVEKLEYRFKAGNVGIHPMSFAEESGRLVGIMGASGAGKSTLLNVLNGTNPPFSGEVTINGHSIHEQSEEVEGLIGYVSQDDLLIEELTVFENLFYNAKLCFDNLTDDEIAKKVSNTLRSLGLFEIRDMKVGSPLNKKISGGQRKRLNISLELIREPAILFLDEPTSGLSSRDSENILDLLKELSLKGKLLFVVIHQPSSDIFKMFDRLIILDRGGYLIFNGDPIESIIYFKTQIHHANYNESECHVCGNVNPEQVFNIVESRVLDEYGQPTETRKISPKEWNEHYKRELEPKIVIPEPEEGVPEINFKTPSRFNQFRVFVKRDILSKLADTQYLLITLLEAPVLAFFLAFLIRYFDESAAQPKYSLVDNSNLPVYLFMSVIVAIFMGLTVSAEEIIKDRKILKREAFLNLSWNSYLMSKVFVQFLISAIQAFTFVILGNAITGVHGMTFEYWLILFSCWASANMLGLLISDSFKAVVTIYILIPFLVIPQIILSGIIVKFEKLNPGISSPISIPFYGEMIMARWGYEALAVKQFKDNKFEEPFYFYDKAMSIANYKKVYWYNTIKGKLNNIEFDYGKPTKNESFGEALELVRNEFAAEERALPDIKFSHPEMLYPDKIDQEIITAAKKHLDRIKDYYIGLYNNANNRKDIIVNREMETNREKFLDLKKKHSNTQLEDFVKNANENDKVIEYKGRVIQKIDPVFLDPQHKMIKAHFYAPRKMVFGIYVDTFTVNVAVIWLMTLLTYLALYFRILKKALESAENFGRG